MTAKIRSCPAVFILTLFAGLLGGCPGGDDIVLEHGVIKLGLLRSPAEMESPYVGTATISATMTYEACLREFYSANPNYLPDGPDGEAVFGSKELGGEGWIERLCENPDNGQVKCTVEEIDQQRVAVQQLTVTYRIMDPAMENKFLKFGPLPDAELAGCEPGVQPLMTSPSVRGFDGAGNEIWTTASSNPQTAATNQGQRVEIRAARN